MLFIKSYFIKAESYKFDKYLKNHYYFGHARKIKNFKQDQKINKELFDVALEYVN